MKTAIRRAHWPHLSHATATNDSGLRTGCLRWSNTPPRAPPPLQAPPPLPAAVWVSTGLGHWTDPEQLFNVKMLAVGDQHRRREVTQWA